jgi:hydrogenase-4 transcriptional activator
LITGSKPDNRAKMEVSLEKSSSSRRGPAREFLEVRPVNGFHQDLESQSMIHSNGSKGSNGASLDQVTASARLTRSEAFSSIIYDSRTMGEIIDKIERSSGSSAPALITGETGTGKELIAQAVHAVSPRYGREFIPYNCGDVGTELIASELFGHRRGAFTGAERASEGVIRAAGGGTLFLDEIGELPFAAQTRLLRFLQEGEVRPLGEARPIKVNVRIIAATNRDLEADVGAGRFRSDLYYRLNVFRIHIPPLRERREDIRPLIEHFLILRQRETGKQGLRLSDEAWALLLAYNWPGNVREAVSLSHRLVASAVNGEVIERQSIPDAIMAQPQATDAIEGCARIALDLPLHEAINKLEMLLVEHALTVTGGNRVKAAARLKIHRDGLRKMINRLKINAGGGGQRK